MTDAPARTPSTKSVRQSNPARQTSITSSRRAAVEEAVRLRERLKGSDGVKSIRAVTIGPPKAAETLRTALAMGADTAVHVEIAESAPAPEPLGVAKALRALIDRENEGDGKVDLVIMGKQAIDDDAGQTGQMLAGLLGWGQATFASKVEVDVAKREAVVMREIDGGSEEIRCRLPLIVTTDLRYVSPSLYILHLLILPRLQAKRTPLRLPPEYHESQKETDRETHRRRPRCRLYAPAGDAQGHRAPNARRRWQGRERRRARRQAQGGRLHRGMSAVRRRRVMRFGRGRGVRRCRTYNTCG